MQRAKLTAHRFHWLILPLLLFTLAQVYSFGLLAMEKDRQEAIPAGDGFQYFVQYHEADPAWETYVAGWNGQAYREIATNGYPVPPPKTDEGLTLPNPWSFYPLYPLSVRAVMDLTGMDFGYAALSLSLLFGAMAVVLLYRLVHGYSKSKWVASLSVATLVLYPTSPLFQLAYNESLALALLAAALTLIHKEKYLWAAIPLVLLGLTRAVGPPDFALILVHGVYLARSYLWPASQWKTGLQVFIRNRKAWALTSLMAFSALGAALWPLLSWVATGEPAFLESRAAYGGESFFFSWLRNGFVTSEAYPLTPFALAAVFLALAVLQLRNHALPPIMRVWPLVLTLYILVVTSPLGNEQRYLMLGMFAFPWARWPDSKRGKIFYGATLFAAFIILLYLQYSWVHYHWVSETGALRKNV